MIIIFLHQKYVLCAYKKRLTEMYLLRTQHVMLFADPLDLLYVMCSCAFATFPYGDLGQVWYLIVQISDLCLLLTFIDTCSS